MADNDDFWHGVPVEEPEHEQTPTIPEVRERLISMATSLREIATEVDQLERWLWRRKAIRRAPSDSVTVTPSIRARIRSLAVEHPEWTELRIGHEVGVNQGRVSEVLAGFRNDR